MISGIPLILGLGNRTLHPYVYVVFWGPILEELWFVINVCFFLSCAFVCLDLNVYVQISFVVDNLRDCT